MGQYTGAQNGPLVVAIGGIHGNEIAGIKAIQEVFRMLEKEPEANPGFQFRGNIVGLVGNLEACRTGQRFLECDMNRIWQPDNVARLESVPIDMLHDEERELRELLQAIKDTIKKENAREVVIIDLHTTSADGGIFSIPLEDDPESIRLAKGLHAPVILGLLRGLNGTLMHYASGNHFAENGLPEKVSSVAFESGQHEDPLSVSRAISAIISLLRAVGCVQEHDVDNWHDEILIKYAANLPALTRLSYVHHINPEMAFKMNPGYLNFQPVKAGEVLASDRNGAITAPSDGLMLMPLYQPKGADGFFIVEEVG